MTTLFLSRRFLAPSRRIRTATMDARATSPTNGKDARSTSKKSLHRSTSSIVARASRASVKRRASRL
tara:strand:- start:692 stop:892 length:201 start_codon:yes stop_codon:yes gene_type:complete